MYYEGSYKDKSDRFIGEWERRYSDGNVSREIFKRVKNNVLQTELVAIKGASDYAFAGQYMKMILHDEDLNENERRKEFELAREALSDADADIRKAVTALSRLIPGFTIARNDSEMFVVATKLAHEYTMYAKVLAVQGKEAEKEFEEVMLASSETAKEYREASKSRIFDDMMSEEEKQLFEVEHVPTVSRMIETRDFGKVEANVYNAGRIMISTLPKKALDSLRTTEEIETKDIVGYVDVIKEDGTVDRRTAVMTKTSKYGICMSTEDFHGLFNDLKEIVIMREPEPEKEIDVEHDKDKGPSSGKETVLKPGNGGEWPKEIDTRKMEKLSMLNGYYRNVDGKIRPAAQRHAYLEEMWLNGESYAVPITKTRIRHYLSMRNLWKENKSEGLKALAEIFDNDAKWVAENLDYKKAVDKRYFKRSSKTEGLNTKNNEIDSFHGADKRVGDIKEMINAASRPVSKSKEDVNKDEKEDRS